MASSRAYIPSAALIRALARPQPLRCPYACAAPAQFARGKKSKAAKAREAEKAQLAQQARKERHAAMSADDSLAEEQKESQEQLKQMIKKKKFAGVAGPLGKLVDDMQNPDKVDKFFEIPKHNAFENTEDSGIDFWELDLGTGVRRKVNKHATVEDRERERETRRMIEESYENPDYDDAELNKRLMDGLIADSAFADLTEELKEIKASIMTKEEQNKMEEDAERQAQPAFDELSASVRMTIHQAVTHLVNDPHVGDAKPALQAVLDKMPQVEDIADPEFQALLDAATEKVDKNPKLQEKLRAADANETEQEKRQWAEYEEEVNRLLGPEEEEDEASFDEELDHTAINDLMREMRDVLRNLNISGNLGAEMDKMLAEPMPNMTDEPEDENGVNFNEDSNPADIASSLARIAAAKSTQAPEPDAEDEEHIPPELKAKVDKIMQDPRLMEKLIYIQNLIAEHTPQRDPNDLTQIDHELAPDPYEMDPSRTTTLAERMAAARADPEHSAAMRSLRVKLQPPFNISPTLKSFNQAIELAYVGANDDVRRVLWRSYQKARTMPTFLQNVSDDAWDILYYSQAVTWSGNQNRTDHLRMLLADLALVGKRGPPTHPSTLGQHEEAARLESAQKEAEKLSA